MLFFDFGLRSFGSGSGRVRLSGSQVQVRFSGSRLEFNFFSTFRFCFVLLWFLVSYLGLTYCVRLRTVLEEDFTLRNKLTIAKLTAADFEINPRLMQGAPWSNAQDGIPPPHFSFFFSSSC